MSTEAKESTIYPHYYTRTEHRGSNILISFLYLDEEGMENGKGSLMIPSSHEELLIPLQIALTSFNDKQREIREDHFGTLKQSK